MPQCGCTFYSRAFTETQMFACPMNGASQLRKHFFGGIEVSSCFIVSEQHLTGRTARSLLATPRKYFGSAAYKCHPRSFASSGNSGDPTEEKLNPPKSSISASSSTSTSGASKVAAADRLLKSKLFTSTVANMSARSSAPSLESWATADPEKYDEPMRVANCVDGEWRTTKKDRVIADPLRNTPMVVQPDTQVDELDVFVASMAKVPKTGLFNIYKNPERFVQWGQLNRRVAEALYDPDTFNFFVKAIQRVMPKSTAQASGELRVLRSFFENFSGDNVRMLMRGFVQAGDHEGQRSVGYRWPYGPVAVIAPFNFPLEIPVMQFVSAAMVGNKPVVKCESRVGFPVEQFLRLMHACGMPRDAVDLIFCGGPVMSALLEQINVKMVQFTGGESAANKVIAAVKGRVRIEDAGFDWKILGPLEATHVESGAGGLEANPKLVEYVAWQCDEDAYALSGQKCSAQSMLLVHTDWEKYGLIDKLAKQASKRTLENLTISPVMSHSSAEIKAHIDQLLSFKKSKVLFGGAPVVPSQNYSVPEDLGVFQPTAVEVDITEILGDAQKLRIATTELFGPVQVVVRWSREEDLLALIDRIDAHLTAAVVSNDAPFINRVLAHSVNGTIYVGLRARTTGAPQNHWFGPAGSPLAAGIGTREAILHTWTCHREVIYDEGPLPADTDYTAKVPS